MQVEEIEQFDKLENEISIGHPGWHDYVLSQLTDEEKKEIPGNPGTFYPTSDGLRRVIECVMGQILESVAKVVKAPDANSAYATVEHKIVILKMDGNVVTFGEAADAHLRNTPQPFNLHLTASAASKAEGRALRKALRLRTIITAEEAITNKEEEEAKWEMFEPISEEQIIAIESLGKRNNINLAKFLNSGSATYTNVDQISYDTAIKIIQELNKYQISDNPKRKSENIVGYSENWKSELGGVV